MKPQFPTIQEQINYWNKIERLEHERVMNIRAESPNERNETRKASITALIDVELRATQAKLVSTIGKKSASYRVGFLLGELERIGNVARAAIAASNPQEQASDTALTLDQTEATTDWFDGLADTPYHLRDEGTVDGEGLSYSARNL